MTTTTDMTGTPRLKWEVPEVAAVAVVVVVAILAIGGIVSGFAIAYGYNNQAFSTRQSVGSALSQGAAWAGPIVALLLLGGLAACWWQRAAWTEAIEDADDEETVAEARRYLGRSFAIGRWIQGAFLIAAIGAIASFVGNVLGLTAPAGTSLPAYLWGRDVYAAGVLLATLVVTTVGLVIARVTWAGE